MERETASPFAFCPSCGAPNPRFSGDVALTCGACGFVYFHNVATAAGVLIVRGGELLLLERAAEPRAGFFALPGGFVGPGERAEDAALRECMEELGWAPQALRFVATYPNRYSYRGVAYNTCDLFFSASAETLDLGALRLQEAEVASARFVGLADLDPDFLAFESARKAIAAYRAGDSPVVRP